jgi:hypothetical protein
MRPRLQLLAALTWVLVVFYPNPTMFFLTLWRTMSPPVDAAAAEDLARTLPNDPNTIRDRVLTDLVVYDNNWAVYGVPWYFPSAAEVVRDGRGDCEGQTILLASILADKGVPYQIKMSFDHMWVDFKGKRASAIESDGLAFAAKNGDSMQIKIPENFDWRQFINLQLDARWHPMPPYRKALLLFGLMVIILGGRLVPRYTALYRFALVPIRLRWRN